MIELLGAVFGLAESVVGYISKTKQVEMRDRLFRLKKEILDEQSKPVADQDDAKLELLYKEVPLIIEAINLELQLKSDKN